MTYYCQTFTNAGSLSLKQIKIYLPNKLNDLCIFYSFTHSNYFGLMRRII